MKFEVSVRYHIHQYPSKAQEVSFNRVIEAANAAEACKLAMDQIKNSAPIGQTIFNLSAVATLIPGD